MAGEIPDLKAVVRTGTGKGAARQARRDGYVPGVVYGGGKDPIAINLKYNELFKLLKKGRFLSTLFNLQVPGEEDVRVICRGVQRDVVKDLPTHVDFMRLRRTSKINLFIHVEFINHEDCPGLKRGGVLNAVRPEVELMVIAGEIPEQITIDLTGLKMGDTITVRHPAVSLPDGTKPTIDRDFVIATIQAPAGLVGGDDEDEAEEAAEA